MEYDLLRTQIANLRKGLREIVMKRYILAVFLIGLIFLSIANRPLYGDDTDIYALQEVPPNVLIVLDHSGSMMNDDAGGVYDDTKTYEPWVGMPDLGNYDNWYNCNRTRWQIAKNVITHLLDETEGVRFGLIRMDGSKYNTGLLDSNDRMDPPRGITYTDGVEAGRVLRQGGKILAPVGTDKNQIITFINNMPNNDPQTWTVLAETLFSAGRYFAGGNDGLGMGAYKSDSDYSYRICTDDDGNCEDDDEEWTSYSARTTDDDGNSIDTSSPIEHWCQRNFVILMTDGEANYDDDWTKLINTVGDYDGDGKEGSEANHYLDDVAKFLYDTDLRGDMEETQNVITYVIGFKVDTQLLKDAAEKGGGAYYTADNYQQLKYALQNIISEILEISTSFTAPVVPISQMEKTTSGSSIYLALFKPTRNAFWKGNIKKFGIATQDDTVKGIKLGDVLDKNGIPATDGTGYILETAVSHWGTDPDGGETEQGGIGKVLLNRTSPRNIYTWTKIDKPLKQPNNAFDKTNPKLTYTMFGVADDAEKDKVIDFVYGLDAYDEDADLDTTEKRKWILGSFIHSAPEVVHYNDTTTVIYAGANDGLFHAFDDTTGEELWAFVRPDLLSQLKNLSGNSIQYFYDAAAQAAIIDNNGNGTIETGDGDKVILIFGERRGGNYTYGLDVSDPNYPIILWYLGPDVPDFSEMGQSWCTPVIGKIAFGDKQVVFLSGGYDTNQDNDPVVAPDSVGKGIYVVDLFTGALVWKYTYGNDPNMQWSIPSDIAAIDTEGNGLIDRLYVGDMGGRLWRFDIGNKDLAKWTGGILFNANSSIIPGEPLRKIFYPPDVSQEDEYEFVFFGSGDRAHPNDEIAMNRIYAVKDKNTGVSLDESSLVDVTLDLLQDPGTSEADKTTIRNNLANGNGWYITLIDNLGEKVLAPALVFNRIAYFTSFTPTPATVVDPCVIKEGTARLYALHYKTGEAVINYDISDDAVEKTDRSLVIGSSIPSGLVMAVIKGRPVGYLGVRGGILKPSIGTLSSVFRVYWRDSQ